MPSTRHGEDDTLSAQGPASDTARSADQQRPSASQVRTYRLREVRDRQIPATIVLAQTEQQELLATYHGGQFLVSPDGRVVIEMAMSFKVRQNGQIGAREPRRVLRSEGEYQLRGDTLIITASTRLREGQEGNASQRSPSTAFTAGQREVMALPQETNLYMRSPNPLGGQPLWFTYQLTATSSSGSTQEP